MSASHTLIIHELIRSPEAGPEDRLELCTGVNVLVGPPNTGKTKWLQMLDFLFGNDDTALDAFGDDIASKYVSVLARMTVSGEPWTVERCWDEGIPKSQVLLNEEAVSVKEFLRRLMSKLNIPILHYPQGNPYGSRSWPELGWRSLYRHIYRRQHLWGDIADRQPESEQHACIVQFSGLAEHLFSPEYGQLVEKEKKIIELRAQKEQFMSVLSQVSKDLLLAKEIGVGLTRQSLETAKSRIESNIEELGRQRQVALDTLSARLKANSGGDHDEVSRLDDLSQELVQHESHHEELLLALQRIRTRHIELATYRSTVEEELRRLERAQKAGSVLADLKVTHCPVCDRPVSQKQAEETVCYLCHRSMDTGLNAISNTRLEWEIEQAKAVHDEAAEMVDVLGRERQSTEADAAKVRRRIVEIRGFLRPVRSAAAAILPPEIGVIDMQMGQLQEQLAQIERVTTSLESRELLTQQIEQIQQESAALEQEVARQSAALDFERASDRLQDAMTTYLNIIKEAAPTSWTQKEARVRINERKVRFLVGDRKWNSQLGGTLSLYFLIAYHYALMSLAREDSCHFPGFVVMDFPAELEDGASVKDTENFVIEPFVRLLASDGYENCQLIVAGGAFENLEGANRIEFSKIWR